MKHNRRKSKLPSSLSKFCRQAELHARITQYLSVGGLFNPELMDHDKVRDLLIDIRDHFRDCPFKSA